MRSDFVISTQLLKKYATRFGLLLILMLAFIVPRVEAQVFNSSSDGSDGIFSPSGPPGTVVLLDPSQFRGTQVAANIFNFTTVTIPSGVTVRLSGSSLNGPVYWLAQGDVDIEGTIDLSGGKGHARSSDPFYRVPSEPGSGGYPGGVGGSQFQAATAGSGPGGGVAAGTLDGFGRGGTFSGNQFLIPLIGGSGGGGGLDAGHNTFDPGGGAGGGAILIASSTRIVINGVVNVNGGDIGVITNYGYPGGGSGGAIRLVAPAISGSGLLTANGGSTTAPLLSPHNGGQGQIRMEASSIAFAGSVRGVVGESTPFPLLLPTAGPPSAKVVSIAGVALTPNPNTFPDITINTTAGVPVVILTHNIPTTATINLTILDENGVADTVIPAPPLGNCDQSNNCTTTVNVVFPFGASRGLTKVTWTP